MSVQNKGFMPLALVLTLLGISLARLALGARSDDYVSNAVVPIIMIAVVAEQVAPRYSTGTGASIVLNTVRIGGFVVGAVLLIVGSVRG